MSKQYHFVVFYDSETEEFTLDYDTQDERFNGEPVWNEETGEWESLGEVWEDDNSDYNRAGDALYRALRTLEPLPAEKDN
jgi:hypothetical protein